ncbi:MULTISPECIES: glycosyltransferase family 1 protein [Bosea]|uniref:glycosyltransferase family 4 protein n=1 Tax=Bosea TaxID=85413 RepID=UPI00214F7643|nr:MULTISPECIES: glycosyltransferase family 1 protein [Bosea]MCR4523751.1 glycosyltransferase family 4 protein [Bosea sp. 47.2.35]MDR6830040.1 glycosyltransferase involved in cell wall biosynthesis [Bosea robiniae]MDR6896999.1 glycosyltransferase involved in cell wall biosynthesis [Bosea sp. BE109]MDR7140320.1 glycosyltransferase involved in cell wall biosynthesis [Bosea sp. BE168]MDR7177093.1 glycosyltransferase involved in cell wall biosynthesis [Bosea sp. BE271]
MQTISINGRFLGQPLTGVQRFALEMTKALDRRIGAGAAPEALRRAQWRLLAPQDVPETREFQHIAVERFGPFSGHLWEQTSLAHRAAGDTLVGFGGSGPLLHRRQLVVIHDVTIFRHPEAFSASYRATHKLLGFGLTRTARIATVSNFSRGELGTVFGVAPETVPVLYNATDHFSGVTPDETVLQRLGLEGTNFFFMLGTLKPNKNVDFAIRAFDALGDRRWKLVIAGALDKSGVFKADAPASAENLIFTGRLSDAEIVALERHARAFVFPSLYEGFGIPPLEAMTQGCPVLAADIPAVREACGEAALYFDPRDRASLEEAMLRVMDADGDALGLAGKGRANLARFSWDKSAETLLATLSEMAAPRR